jgi:hypothetical protein
MQLIHPGPDGAILARGEFHAPEPHISQPIGYKFNDRLVWIRPHDDGKNLQVFGIRRDGDWSGVYAILPNVGFVPVEEKTHEH